MLNVPTYQVPPQVLALANRQPGTSVPLWQQQPGNGGTGFQAAPVSMPARTMTMGDAPPVAPWQLSQQQQAAVSGAGPGMMPVDPRSAAAAAQAAQFAAGASRGLAGGLGVGQNAAAFQSAMSNPNLSDAQRRAALDAYQLQAGNANHNLAMDAAQLQGNPQYANLPPQIAALAARRAAPMALPGTAQPGTQPVQPAVRADASGMAGGQAAGAYRPFWMR